MNSGIFVTGTDTEVGKTLVSAAIMHQAKKLYDCVLGYKPVVAGLSMIDGKLENEDVLVLQKTGSRRLDPDWICPYRLTKPIAPHIAAHLDNIKLEPSHMLSGYSKIKDLSDFVVVEGVGGFVVPITNEYDTSRFAQDIDLPVVLVVGIRLGCLNHALLSAEIIAKRGLKLLGWVANCIDPNISKSIDPNIETLRKLLEPPCLGTIPFLQNAQTPYTNRSIGIVEKYLEIPLN